MDSSSSCNIEQPHVIVDNENSTPRRWKQLSKIIKIKEKLTMCYFGTLTKDNSPTNGNKEDLDVITLWYSENNSARVVWLILKDKSYYNSTWQRIWYPILCWRNHNKEISSSNNIKVPHLI